MTSTSRSEATFSSSGLHENQAASAALYATRDTHTRSTRHPILDEDGKLSSASAATSLKYARAQDLPSYPSAGLKMSSAGAAASLADSKKKSFELWQPSAIPAANQAADQAMDYQMDPPWESEPTKAGNSAAGQALKMKLPGAITERESPADSRKKALMAATGAMASGRKRADSAPTKPKEDNGWALKAARGSQRAPAPKSDEFTTGDPGFEAARLQNMSQKNVNRQMYGSAPPVQLEVDERNRQAMLKASAVAMARKMYAIQQAHIDEAKAAQGRDAAAGVYHRQRSDTISSNEEEGAEQPRFGGLEAAAKKLAMERLAKLHDEHAEYRQYYGPTTPVRNRMSVRGSRGRASSDEQTGDNEDEENSRKIRAQMSMFQSKLSAVDLKKRQDDRDAVMAAAYKNVTKSMAAMDEKVFQETGQQNAQQKELWAKGARERAQKDSDARMVNHGKVHIGGGKYMDQSEVDAIAKARLQPTLDEISEKAEAQRARDEELRIEEEKRKRDIETEKTRQAQIKAEERVANQKEKADAKARRDEEKKVQKEEVAARKAEANAEKERLRLEVNTRKEEARAAAAAERERLAVAKLEGAKGTTVAGETAGVGSGAFLSDATHSGSPEGGYIPEPNDEGVPITPHPELADDMDNDLEQEEGQTAFHHQSTITPGVEEVGEKQFLSARPGTKEFETDGETSPNAAELKQEAIATPLPTGDEAEKAMDAPASPNQEEDGVPAAPLPPMEPLSPTKSNSKVKTWFKSRFRSGSKSEKNPPSIAYDSVNTPAGTAEPINEEKETDSMRDVAMAGKSTTNETEDMYGASERGVSPVKDEEVAPNDTGASPASRSPSISSASSLYSKEQSKHNLANVEEARSTTSSEPPRGRRGFKERMMGKISSPKEYPAYSTTAAAVKSDGEDDDFEEARDTFEQEKLSPPTKAVGDDSTMPLTQKTSKEGSKFKEAL